MLELRREGWLSLTVEGDVPQVTYGERMREIAKEWGIELREAQTKSETRTT